MDKVFDRNNGLNSIENAGATPVYEVFDYLLYKALSYDI